MGYGDVTPVTTEGRIAAMALMLLGIGLFSAITATITSYLMTHEMHAVEPDEPAATGRTTTVERTSSAGSSLVSKLERLAALYRRGDLTHDEFAAAKERALHVDRTRGA